MSKKIIAWDSSSPTGAVVAFEITGGKFRLVSEWSLSFETSKHSERLLWAIDTVLKSTGWALSDLTAIGIGVGPGSFTGLRIGITTAKILATELNIPIVPISSLAILARGVTDQLKINPAHSNALIIACTDATKGEWFTLLGSTKSVIEKALTPDEVIAAANEYLMQNPNESWFAFGQSVERYPEIWKSLPSERKINLESSTLNLPQPRVLAQLVFEGEEAGIITDGISLKPRYLRDSEAEVKLRKGLLKTQPVTLRN